MEQNKKIFSKIGLNYLILAILSNIIFIVLVNILAIWDINLAQNINTQTILSSLSSYVIMLPIFILLMKKIESEDLEKRKISIKTLLKYICVAMTLMWIGNLIGTLITTAIGFTMSNEVVNPIETLIQNSSIYINLFLISIIGPIFEEIFFRKLLIDRTIKYGAKLSILLSALLFALFHGNLSQFFYAFLMGGFFAYVYIKTGKIIYPIILHIFINFYGSVASTFFTIATQNLSHGINMTNTGDIAIIAAYMIVLIAVWFVGLYTILTNYNKIDLNDSKREIWLEKPFQTVILNIGMILFIAFHIFKILKSLNVF